MSASGPGRPMRVLADVVERDGLILTLYTPQYNVVIFSLGAENKFNERVDNEQFLLL